MSLHTYKCPSCGAPLKWEPSAGRIACDYCNSSFSVEEVENFNQELQAKEEAAVAAEQALIRPLWESQISKL